MSLTEIYQQFISDMYNTRWYEYVAVFAGIASVWYSRAENILVYPVGLINTIIYIYISIKGNLLGEATVNLYYTAMSIIGWYMWLKKDTKQEVVLHITHSNKKEWINELLMKAHFVKRNTAQLMTMLGTMEQKALNLLKTINTEYHLD